MTPIEWEVKGVALGCVLDLEDEVDLERAMHHCVSSAGSLYQNDKSVAPLQSLSLAPLRAILDVARRNGCRTIIFERQYIDLDYRSEFSGFWSTLFDDKPSLVTRAHFFEKEVLEEDLHRIDPSFGYLGYAVLKPTRMGPIGRTVLVPPRDLADPVFATVREEPNVFGCRLPFRGVPFYQQDGILMRCAHVVVWAAVYNAQEFAGIQRTTSGAIAMAETTGSRSRRLPATGLKLEQMQQLLGELKLPGILQEIDELPEAEPTGPVQRILHKSGRNLNRTIAREVCKYLNSGLTVIVLAGQHAITLVGWYKGADGSPVLIANDDQVGPFQEVNPERSHCGEWDTLVIPVPEKVILSGAGAETRAENLFDAYSEIAETGKLVEVFNRWLSGDDEIALKGRLIEGKTYKEQAAYRGLPDEVVRKIRLAKLPHWVWVSEMQEREALNSAEPCVRAELVFDSTSHDDDPIPHIVLTPEQALDTMKKDKDDAEDYEGDIPPWLSIVSQEQLIQKAADRAMSPRAEPETPRTTE